MKDPIVVIGLIVLVLLLIFIFSGNSSQSPNSAAQDLNKKWQEAGYQGYYNSKDSTTTYVDGPNIAVIPDDGKFGSDGWRRNNIPEDEIPKYSKSVRLKPIKPIK